MCESKKKKKKKSGSKGGLFALAVLRGCDYTVKKMSHSFVLLFGFQLVDFYRHNQIGGFDVCTQKI